MKEGNNIGIVQKKTINSHYIHQNHYTTTTYHTQKKVSNIMTSFNEIAGNTLLFFLVFGMSATVDIHMLVAQLRNAKAIFMGVFLQFIILPLCGFLVVKFFELEQSVGITLLVVTSSPGGSYSNW